MKSRMFTVSLSKSLALMLAVSAMSFKIQAANSPLSQQQIADVVSASDRPQEDRQRDESRKPAQVLTFTGIGKGQVVLDFFAGGGWYTELISKAVGETGKVYMQNDSVYWQFAQKDIIKRTQDNRLPNVVRLDNVALSEMPIPDNSVDIIFAALGYHDLYFTDTVRDGKVITFRDDVVDYMPVLSTFKRILKEDGVVVIIDHSAKAGSGFDAANTLHRIDPNIIKHQFESAGFTLTEEAFYLRNPEDDLQKSVFAADIRGKTDRFIFKFGK
tara:strand:- start:846 stop:1658 length:813 start_codon:yes stop_codon:yes gene_type:complete